MKKWRNRLFACGISAFMLLNALPLQTAQTAIAAEIEAASRGDINGDGKKDSADLEALKTLLATRPDTIVAETEDLVPYDVTGDSIVDARDTLALSQYVSGAAKELPLNPGEKLADKITLALESKTCFPGDDVSLKLSVVDWTKDIAAYDITVGFDTALKLKNVAFFADDCQYIPAARTVKLTGLHKDAAMHRGDIAVLTFTVPKDYEEDCTVAVEGANVFTSDYNYYSPVRPTAKITVNPLTEPVALEAAGIGSKSVSLIWDMPFADQPVVGYHVYRSGKQIAETTDTAYTDSGLTADTDYEYAVSAFTAAGTETAQSVPVKVHTAGPKIRSAEFPAETVSDANSDLIVRLEQAAPLKEMKLDVKGPDGKTVSEVVSLEDKDLSAVNYHWDVSQLTNGTYQIGITVTDLDGASDTDTVSVKVENKPLSQVTLKGTAGDRTAVLAWSLAEEASVTGYTVYRLKADGKTWEAIAEIEGRNTLSYTDTQLTAGEKYTYAVASKNRYGQESQKSTGVTVTPKADSTPPEITLFTPKGGQRVSGKLSVKVQAKDENSVASVRCELSADEGETWTTAGETEGDTGSWTINTKDYADGIYRLRAMASDSDGNRSADTHVIELAFDNTPPEQVQNVRAVSITEKTAAIAWDNVADEDFAYFNAIISDSSKKWEQKTDKTLGINLENLTPDTTYTVTVYAVDAAGNAGAPSDTFSFVSTSDNKAPVIKSISVPKFASAKVALTVGVEASDDAGIAKRFLEYSQDQKNWKKLVANGSKTNFTLSDSTLKEGALYLRAYAEDKYGNTGDPEKAKIVTLTVDNTPPDAPGKATAAADILSNIVTWEASPAGDLNSYCVERSVTSATGGYTTVAANLTALRFEDTDVKPDGTYYYRVFAIDRAGNKSKAVSADAVKRVPDTTEPVIEQCVLSVQGKVCAAHRTVQILASDDTAVKSISAAYRYKENADWTALTTELVKTNSNKTQMLVRTELPESVLKESGVTVQVTAEDAVGNKKIQEFAFQVDDSKAEIKNAKAALDGKQINVTWDCPDASGVTVFYVYRKTGAAGEEFCIGKADPKKGSAAYSFTDTDLTAGGTMYYRIEANMENGNTVSASAGPVEVQAIPKARLDYTPAQLVGAEYTYDARSSEKAEDITCVKISFGDATEEIVRQSLDTAVFTHTYTSVGEYEVTLTVLNGNGVSDVIKKNVSVTEPAMFGDARLHVTQSDGSPAAYAKVYIDAGTNMQTTAQTDANGIAAVKCTAGGHEFGVYMPGCLPVTKYCTLTPDMTTDVYLTLMKDDIVKADFQVSRMSLAEIKAAGIDVEDPENCNIVQVDISLSYSVTSTVTDRIRVYVNQGGGSGSGGGTGGGTGGGRGRYIVQGGGSGSGGSGYSYEVQEVSRDVNTLVLLRVPAKAQFLKEFFKVDMIVLNNASSEFPLTGCKASLNLPEGLSLASDSASYGSPIVNIGTIPGGQQETVSWVVRGDRAGSYSFSADFSGTLQPFNEPVSMRFGSEQQITVEGAEAASITVNFDPVIRKKNMLVEMVIENNTSGDLNELSTDIGNVIRECGGTDAAGNPKADVYQVRFIDTDGIMQLVDSADIIKVLHPGQKLSVVYDIKNVLESELQGVYKNTSGALRHDSNSSNVVVQIKPVKLTSVDDPLYGIALDPEKEYLLMFSDRNGKAVPYTAVEIYELNGTVKTVLASGTADERGRFVVPRGDAEKQYYVAAAADGFAKAIRPFKFPKRIEEYLTTFMLEGNYNNSDYHVRYANFSSSTDFVNLITKDYIVNIKDDTPFSIIGSTKDAGAKYELRQKDVSKAIKTTEGDYGSFAFMELSPSMFHEDRPVFIRVYTDKGDTFDTTLGLQVVNVSPEKLAGEMDDKLADTFSDFLLKNDLVGTIPGEYHDEIDDLALDENGTDKNDKDSKFLDLDFSIDLTQKMNKKDLDWDIKHTVNKDKVSAEFLMRLTKEFSFLTKKKNCMLRLIIGGGANIDIKTSQVYISGTLTLYLWGSFYHTLYEHWIPPWYIGIEPFFNPTLTGKINGGIDYTNDPVKGDPFFNYKVGGDALLGCELQGGAGVKCVGTIYAYGSIGLNVSGTFLEKGQPVNLLGRVDRFALEGSIGVRGEVLEYRWMDIQLIKAGCILYDRAAGIGTTEDSPSLPRPLLITPNDLVTENGETVAEAIKDTGCYKPFTADMIPQAGAWNGQLGDSITELQSGISAGSSPALVTDGTNTVMVWILKDAARGIDNASYAVWSRYDSESKTWSEPKAVDDNGNADTAPVLFAGADGIRLAYLESAAVFEEGNAPSLEDYAKQLVFKTAKFDPEADAFTDFRTTEANADGGFASAPAFAQAADGTTYLFWLSNANGQIFGGDGSNRILCAKETEEGFDTPTVLAENLPQVESLICGQNAAGEPVCVYTVSAPTEENTNASELYVKGLSGDPVQLASGTVRSPQFAKIPGKDAEGLVWAQDGNLYASADLAAAEEICVSENFRISERFAIAGDRILYLSNIDNAAALFSTQYDAESGSFTNPVCIESGETLYYETLSLADVGGDTLYAMSRTTETRTEDSASYSTALTSGILQETADVRIGEIEYTYEDAMPGTVLPLTAEILNDGTLTADTVTLQIKDAEGNVAASDTQNVHIVSGASEKVSFAPALPETLTPAVYTVSVSAFDRDRTPDNNTAELDLSKTDIAVETGVEYIGDNTFVTISAKNLSNVPSSAVISVKPNRSDEETVMLFSDEIAPHKVAYWRLNAADLLGSVYNDFLEITAETDVPDGNPNNNQTAVRAAKSGINPYKTGDLNLDGTVELEDAMLTLKCYTKSVAGLNDTGLTYWAQEAADIDKNGKIDVIDAMTILKYYVNCVAGNASATFEEYLTLEQNGGAKHESE